MYPDLSSFARRIAKAWVYPGITASLSNYLALNERRPPERAARMTAVEMRDADMAYWVGFASDKMACSMSSWPSSYREEDITAFLPTRPGPHVSIALEQRLQLRLAHRSTCRESSCNLVNGSVLATFTFDILSSIAM
jgi:hypothetical protein